MTASYHLDDDGIGRPQLLDCPIVLRIDQETFHLRDEAGPYRLETADRRTLALSA